MLSDFQRAKLERRFELLDADGDGHIGAPDYDTAALNVCQSFGFGPGSSQYEKVRASYQRLWSALGRAADEPETGRLARDRFVAACERLLVDAEDGYDQLIAPIALTIFEFVDVDAAGTLGIEELTTWFNSYGVCADDAERAFKSCDRNGDGLLSVKELLKAIREFYTGDDPQAVGTAIFGPLPITAAARGKNGSRNGAAPAYAVDSRNGAPGKGGAYNGGHNGAGHNGAGRDGAARDSANHNGAGHNGAGRDAMTSEGMSAPADDQPQHGASPKKGAGRKQARAGASGKR